MRLFIRVLDYHCCWLEDRALLCPGRAGTDRQGLESARSCHGSRNARQTSKIAGRAGFRGIGTVCQTGPKGWVISPQPVFLAFPDSGDHVHRVRPGPSGSHVAAMSD